MSLRPLALGLRASQAPVARAASRKTGISSLSLPFFVQGYRRAQDKDIIGAKPYLDILRADYPEAAATHMLAGLIAHLEGDQETALDLLEKANQDAPRQSIILMALTSVCRALKFFEKGEGYFYQLLALEPNDGYIYDQMARFSIESNKVSVAEDAARQAVALEPENADYWNTYGFILRRAQSYKQALAAWKTAHTLDPQNVIFLNNMGDMLLQLGELTESEQVFLQAADLARQQKGPFWVSYEGLAQVYRQQGNEEKAAALLQKALEEVPTSQREARRVLLVALSNILRGMGDAATALDCLKELDGEEDAATWNARALASIRLWDRPTAIEYTLKAISFDENNPSLWANLILLYVDLGEYERAEEARVRVCALDEDNESVLIAAGILYTKQEKMLKALDCYEKAHRINDRNVIVLANLSCLYYKARMYKEAEAICIHAIDSGIISSPLLNSYASILLDQGHLSEALQVWIEAIYHAEKEAEANDSFESFFSNLCYTINYDLEATFDEKRQLLECYVAALGSTDDDLSAPHLNDPDPERRLKIAYMSPDLRTHSVAYFLEPLLKAMGRSGVHVTLYSDVETPDAMTERLRALADDFVDIHLLHSKDVAQRIRDDRIDILIELAGHTANNRLSVMARKPAPVQFTWLGYPASTGLPEIDGRIIDSITDPEDTQEWASERLLRLPRCFIAYGPPPTSPDPAPLPPSETKGFMTFGSFNTGYKISAQVIEAWAKILAAVPNARLLLKARQYMSMDVCSRIRSDFARYGVPAEQLLLVGAVDSFQEHLMIYRNIDLALDTFPYNGTTTTCEAMWMGVPTLTLAGSCHASRVGTSLLTTVGLNEPLVAHTIDDYVQRAIAFANSPAELRSVRDSLRQRMLASDLCNADTLATEMERLMRAEWVRWCKGPQPTYGRHRVTDNPSATEQE